MAKEEMDLVLSDMTDRQIMEAMVELHAKAAGESISSILKTGIEIVSTEMKEMTLQEVDYGILEPAIFVRYCLTNQVAGTMAIILRQRDMQAFLNELMGIDDLPDPDFEFDDVAMSAAGELMNQMVHASVDVVAETLDSKMASSSCQLSLSDGTQSLAPIIGELPDTRITVISYRMKIKDIVETEFLECISAAAMESFIQEIQTAREKQKEQKSETLSPIAAGPEAANAEMASGKPAAFGSAAEYAERSVPAAMSAEGRKNTRAQAISGNLNLIMDVPLNVSVVIGKTRRSLKDIMNFSNGTVVELDKQADAPVDIIVNGQLIARGEVVVIDDNFGVRVSEIVNTKDIIGSGGLI